MPRSLLYSCFILGKYAKIEFNTGDFELENFSVIIYGV